MKNIHKHLLNILIKKDEDYQPWGKVERWADPNKGYPDCSCGCKWAMWLEDKKNEPGKPIQYLSMDWCVCANPESHRVGLLTFEHQGCEKFEGERDEE